MALPLAGARVLDLTRVLAGPLCTMMLGDLGADVLKIERPGTGDETRGWGPPFDTGGQSAYFLAVNRNKLSLALDLDTEDDRLLRHRLIAGADVVVDNFRPGTLERRGLDPLRLLAVHPRLLWCTLTGFGPASGRPGYDFVIQAESG
ncbi:MAG TPA: CoA transferase, partial [Gemmatimonadales bacterium]|nr:CoA transferase [Gemmatimonadales bacterium]